MGRPLPFLALLATASFLTAPVAVKNADGTSPAQKAETLAMWKKIISIPSVQGRGQMRVMADYIAGQLRDAGSPN